MTDRQREDLTFIFGPPAQTVQRRAFEEYQVAI